MEVIIPTLPGPGDDYGPMFAMWQSISTNFPPQVAFSFKGCRFLGPEAVAFLGGMVRQLELRGCRVTLLWDTLMPAVRSNLIQNGFLHAFGSRYKPKAGNSVPFREDRQRDPVGFVRYLDTLWLGKRWVRVSEALKGAVTSRLAEAYLNAFEHGQSDVGVFCCGQHFPKKGELRLGMVDFGVGIPANVRDYSAKVFKIPPNRLPAANCLEWAFRKGTSTKPDSSRGLGLDLIRSFVQVNNGKLEMFSHDGYAIMTKTEKSFGSRDTYFRGTLVSVMLKCDGNFYKLASETAPIY